MTTYVMEFFEKGQQRPYRTSIGTLENGYRPRYTNTEEGLAAIQKEFNSKRAARVKIRYKSNMGLVAEARPTNNGKGRLKWFRS